MADSRTCFKCVDYGLAGLLHYIDVGDIGLPDIQRPFVWPPTRVRDLFDSMYRGFPVGYLLFWANNSEPGTKHIGSDAKAHKVPNLLIVDGQQRLTSLYAVFRGKEVLDDNYRYRTIEIAFNAITRKFEVSDAAIKRNPEYIANISEVWSSGSSSYAMVKKYLKRLSEHRELSDQEEEIISHNLDRLFDLQKYPFTALEIASTVDEEEVADIFVRINSEGVKLNQADFILTLLSVFWDEGRKELQEFSRGCRMPSKPGTPSPYNHYIEANADQMLRVAIAYGFNRGRLKSVYQILRGKDPATGEYTAVKRDMQFDILKDAQKDVLNIATWHQFLSSINAAGYRSGSLISSNNALLYTYALYLHGYRRLKIAIAELDRIISRWFYAITVTSRYTGSFESQVDEDFGYIKSLDSKQEFISWIEREISTMLTSDFWSINLTSDLSTSASRSPSLFGYIAAQVILDAPVLFSHKKLRDMLDPVIQGPKAHLERHHLFPKQYLKEIGIEDTKEINQIANFAYLEWPENISISDESPSKYVPKIKKRYTDREWETMQEFNALPNGWEKMEYSEFLNARRELMANIMKKAFQKLSGQ